MSVILSLLTYIAYALIVLALAATLVTVYARLRVILRTLGTVNAGLRAIARRVEPLTPVLAEINADLGAVRDGLGAVLEGAAHHPEGDPVR